MKWAIGAQNYAITFYAPGCAEQDGFQAEQVIKDWIGFYNTERPQTALDKRTPHDSYFEMERAKKAA